MTCSQIIYGEECDSSGQFAGLLAETRTGLDSTRHIWASRDTAREPGVVQWDDPEQRECIRDCFVTGNWGEEGEEEDFGDFEVRWS